jgi:hypothetical protein
MVVVVVVFCIFKSVLGDNCWEIIYSKRKQEAKTFSRVSRCIFYPHFSILADLIVQYRHIITYVL